MFDPEHIRQVALALRTQERYIEKDWHVVRALGVIAAISSHGVTPVFSGGTSLSTAWQLINRFSEDIDFKVEVKAASPSAERKLRSAYRESVIKALSDAGFSLEGTPLVGNMSRFFRASFHYGPVFPEAPGLRPTLQIEMTFSGTLLPPFEKPVQSLFSRTMKSPPEVAALACVDPVETAADKLSALAWRTAARNRASAADDPTIVRHLHDLAALAPTVASSPELRPLALRVLAIDAKRSGIAGAEGRELLHSMLPTIVGDRVWRREYEQFVGAVAFGQDADRISYEQAVKACEAMVAKVL